MNTIPNKNSQASTERRVASHSSQVRRRPTHDLLKRRIAGSSATVWIGVFLTWLLILSGYRTPLMLGRATGVRQVYQLQELKAQRVSEIELLSKELSDLQGEIHALRSSLVRQEREVRRVLGYVRKDELVFDFSKSLVRPSPAASVAQTKRTLFKFF